MNESHVRERKIAKIKERDREMKGSENRARERTNQGRKDE